MPKNFSKGAFRSLFGSANSRESAESVSERVNLFSELLSSSMDSFGCLRVVSERTKFNLNRC